MYTRSYFSRIDLWKPFARELSGHSRIALSENEDRERVLLSIESYYKSIEDKLLVDRRLQLEITSLN